MKSVFRGGGWWVVLALTASACGTQELAGLDGPQGTPDLQNLSGAAPSQQAPSFSELDLTAPESVAVITPGPDANGQYHGPVSLSIQATDDASGVEGIIYSLSGATTGNATVAGSTVNLTLTQAGTTSITFFARDLAQNLEYSHTVELTLVVAPPPPSIPCVAIDLNDYNVFVLGDYSGGTDVQGKVAAGGNIDMESFSVGAGLQASDINNVLVASGNLNLHQGGIFGNASYGGTTTADGTVTFDRGALAQGTPIHFAAAGVALTQLSANLHAQGVNGVTRTEAWGGLFLEGTDATLNVFQVDASVFATTKYLSINAPAQSMVVVNIVGETATFANFSTDFGGGINQTGVLYNFVNATTINAFSFGFWGTVLAPYAHVNFSNGSFDGAIYAASMSGSAEGHLNPLREIDLCFVEPG